MSDPEVSAMMEVVAGARGLRGGEGHHVAEDAPGKDHVVSLLRQEWSVIGDLLSGLGEREWSLTVLPGWDVHDVVAHMIGTERMLAGVAGPAQAGEGAADAAGGAEPHVRNEIGRVNEAWVRSLRDLPHAELLAEFRAITAARLAALEAMTAADFGAPSWTPAGQGTYGRFMEIRVFDCWMHEQDIRAAAGRPGHEDGPVAEQALAEVTGALGYIVGKRGRAPDGSSVLIALDGPIRRDLHVAVAGRARVVPALDGPPTATIRLSSSLFLRLAGGREDPVAAIGRVELGGDADLARQIATSLAFTI